MSPCRAIDMVFTYGDGSDPVHAARRAACAQALGLATPGRGIWYEGMGEITYGVRSVLASMPWVRTIHIVTDNQVPPIDADLMASDRVRIVDHATIIPAEYRPVFASTIIESFLHRIPGLSEVWLYSNDDFLHGGIIGAEDFLVGGLCEPLLRLRTLPAAIRLAIAGLSRFAPPFVPRANAYTSGIANSARLLRQGWNLPWHDIVSPRHVTQVYRTATALDVESRFSAELHRARLRHFRGTEQLSWGTLCYSAECHWRGALRHLEGLVGNESETLFVDLSRCLTARGRRRAWQKVAQSRAKFICLNNIPTDEASAFHRTMAARGLGEPVQTQSWQNQDVTTVIPALRKQDWPNLTEHAPVDQRARISIGRDL